MLTDGNAPAVLTVKHAGNTAARNRSCRFAILLFSLMVLFTGCNRDPEAPGPKYVANSSPAVQTTCRFAVHPLYNPTKLGRVYQPLLDYLNTKIANVSFVLEASRDYANYEEKFREGELEFLLPNPWQTIEAMKAGYEVIAMAGDPEDFKGIFIVRKDSKIRKPADLKGKAVGYPAPTALAACMMPQYYLYEHGIDVNKQIENRYVGSQESSIMNAYLGQTAIAATWPPPWRAFQKDHPKEASELKVIWMTPSLINNSVMVRKDLPAGLKERVRKELLSLHTTPEGRLILDGMETARFYEANDATYGIAHKFVDRFEKDVRKVNQR